MERSLEREVSALLVTLVINQTLIKLIALFVLKELSHLMDLLVFLAYKDRSPPQKERPSVSSAQ